MRNEIKTRKHSLWHCIILLLNGERELLRAATLESVRWLDVQDGGQRDHKSNAEHRGDKNAGQDCGRHEANALVDSVETVGLIESWLHLNVSESESHVVLSVDESISASEGEVHGS